MKEDFTPQAKTPVETSTCSHLTCDVLLIEYLSICDLRNWIEPAKTILLLRANEEYEALKEAVAISRILGRPLEEERSLRASTAIAFRAATTLRDRFLSIAGEHASMPELKNIADEIVIGSRKRIGSLPLKTQESIDNRIARAQRNMILGATGASASEVQLDVVDQSVHREALVGLALSGGGIRSASFCLGAIQGLSKMGLLSSIHYVSGVSGGGYIASWLTAFAYRHRNGINGVQEALHKEPEVDIGPLHWVRRHCSYLAPRLGSVLSTDAWALLAGYVSAWFPVLILLLLTCFAAALLPHIVYSIALQVSHSASKGEASPWAMSIALATLFVFMAAMRRLLSYYRLPGSIDRDPMPISKLVILGFILASLGVTAALPALAGYINRAQIYTLKYSPIDDPFFLFVIGWAFMYGGASAFGNLLASKWGQLAIETVRQKCGARSRGNGALIRRHEPSYTHIAAFLITSMIAACIHRGFLYPFSPTAENSRLSITFGPLAMASVFAASELLAMALAHKSARETDAAWFSRLGGWILAGSLIWLCFAGITLWSEDLYRITTAHWINTATVAFILISSFIVAEMLKKSVLAYALLFVALSSIFVHTISTPAIAYIGIDNLGGLFISFLLLLSATALLAWRLDPNRFSLHHLYKEGLVRTFLGASRLGPRNLSVEEPKGVADEERKQFSPRIAEPVTDIDEEDNPALSWLKARPDRKFPILLLNAAINGRSNVDSEGRVPRQWPFTFSPYFCGSSAGGVGFAETSQYFQESTGRGLTLGTAMAVSGAAVSPTSGASTRSMRAFLLGLANARLGFWLGNPSHPDAIKKSHPSQRGLSVLREALAMRPHFGKVIHLSDGGHFENLGLFELLRRGCRRIILIDASCDPRRSFGDLANAIRRAKIDLGIDIVGNINQKTEREEPRHWMWFKIVYGEDLPMGRLLYIKPSVHKSSALPPQVFDYLLNSPSFPHETTADQFFSEAQMEAYRSLGQHSVEEAIDTIFNGPIAEDRDAYLYGSVLRAAENA